jgi:hypothetical protein
MLDGISIVQLGDKVIMDEVYDKKGKLTFSAADVKWINRCRMFLHAETLADICNAEGTHILKDCMELHEAGRRHTDELWLRQPRPGPEHRRTWKRFLREACTDNWTLLSPLGKWISQPRIEWRAYYDKQCHKALTTEDFNNWTEWDLEPGSDVNASE